jgi:hypothetical protein
VAPVIIDPNMAANSAIRHSNSCAFFFRFFINLSVLIKIADAIIYDKVKNPIHLNLII